VVSSEFAAWCDGSEIRFIGIKSPPQAPDDIKLLD
jgi:hypothetical protein